MRWIRRLPLLYRKSARTWGPIHVLHSGDQYLGRATVTSSRLPDYADTELRSKLYFVQKSVGAVSGPQDCFSYCGFEDLACYGGPALFPWGGGRARWLRAHPASGEVVLCGLKIIRSLHRQKADVFGGGMIGASPLKTTARAAMKVLCLLHQVILALAEKPGWVVKSLINHPASMTHASIPRE